MPCLKLSVDLELVVWSSDVPLSSLEQHWLLCQQLAKKSCTRFDIDLQGSFRSQFRFAWYQPQLNGNSYIESSGWSLRWRRSSWIHSLSWTHWSCCISARDYETAWSNPSSDRTFLKVRDSSWNVGRSFLEDPLYQWILRRSYLRIPHRICCRGSQVSKLCQYMAEL